MKGTLVHFASTPYQLPADTNETDDFSFRTPTTFYQKQGFDFNATTAQFNINQLLHQITDQHLKSAESVYKILILTYLNTLFKYFVIAKT